MPFYESVYIARQDISPQQVEALTEGFSEIVRERGGQVGRTEYWGLRSLSYRIKKNRKGHYVLMNLEAPADAVHEMERRMRLEEDIIRFMTIRTDKLEEGPSIMMQTRTAREGSRRDFPRDRDRDRDRDRGRGRPEDGAAEGGRDDGAS